MVKTYGRCSLFCLSRALKILYVASGKQSSASSPSTRPPRIVAAPFRSSSVSSSGLTPSKSYSGDLLFCAFSSCRVVVLTTFAASLRVIPRLIFWSPSRIWNGRGQGSFAYAVLRNLTRLLSFIISSGQGRISLRMLGCSFLQSQQQSTGDPCPPPLARLCCYQRKGP